MEREYVTVDGDVIVIDENTRIKKLTEEEKDRIRKEKLSMLMKRMIIG